MDRETRFDHDRGRIRSDSAQQPFGLASRLCLHPPGPASFRRNAFHKSPFLFLRGEMNTFIFFVISDGELVELGGFGEMRRTEVRVSGTVNGKPHRGNRSI